MSLHVKLGHHFEWFAAVTATAGWGAWLHNALDPILLIFSVLLTGITLFFAILKLIDYIRKPNKQIKHD